MSLNSTAIAVAGAGLIGREHIKRIMESDSAHLSAIIDPTSAAAELAQNLGCAHYETLEAALTTEAAQGYLLATPNQLHAVQARLCIDAGVPVLVEKPLCDTLESAEELISHYRALAAPPPVLVGHHRAYSSIMATATDLVASGKLGSIVAVQGSALFYKPAHYFKEGVWRTQPGGGPILLNLIHEIGNLRQLAGEITEVYALASNSQRGYAVEDSCAITLKFASGALGTFLLSDTAASPKSWEQTAGENKSYASYPDQSCYHLAGTQGSVSIPNMQLHYYNEATDPSWWNPFEQSQIEITEVDPLVAQIESFVRVIRGEEKPRVSIEDGFENLRVVDAISRSANTGTPIRL